MRLLTGIGVLLALSVTLGAIAAPGPPPAVRPPPPGERPERIVSATLSTDEILLALLEPGQLLGVTHFALDPAVSNVPARARRVDHAITGEPEQILALEPDVVFADPVGRPETRALLARAGVPLLKVPAVSSLQDIEDNVRWVARFVGEPRRGEALVAQMERTVDDTRERLEGVERPRVLLYNRGGFTAGAGTLFDDILRRAGGRNAAAEAGIAGHASLPVERALELDPDVVLTTDYHADGRARSLAGHPPLADDPVWQGARAVREGRVHGLDGRHVLSTSHHAADAVPDVARLLHPERFE